MPGEWSGLFRPSFLIEQLSDFNMTEPYVHQVIAVAS